MLLVLIILFIIYCFLLTVCSFFEKKEVSSARNTVLDDKMKVN